MSKIFKRTLSSVGLMMLLLWFMVSNVGASLEPPNEVDLTIDNESITIETSEKTVERVLESVDYEYEETDRINYELDDRVIHEMEIVVNSEKKISLSEGGNVSTIKTNAGTVKELIEESEIELNESDVIFPSLESKLEDKDEVAVIYYKEKEYKETSKIKYEVDKKYSSNIAYGEKVVKQKGKNGKKESVYKEITKNDVVLSDKKISEEIISEPTNEQVIIGTKEIVEESIPKETITKENSSMYKGESKVVKKGKDGIEEKLYHNDGKERILISKEIIKEPVNKVIEEGTKDKPVEAKTATSTSSKYTLSQFQHHGVVHDGGRKFTYYSQSVLSGGGLKIPGRHVNSSGYVADGDGYIVIASNRSISKGTVIDTPFGHKGKVYDICASCTPEWFDVYTK